MKERNGLSSKQNFTQIQLINNNITEELCRLAVERAAFKIGGCDIHHYFRLGCIQVGDTAKEKQMESLGMEYVLTELGKNVIEMFDY